MATDNSCVWKAARFGTAFLLAHDVFPRCHVAVGRLVPPTM